MAKQPNKTQAGTSVQHVKQQNAQAGQQAGAAQQYGTEFAAETNATNAQEVKQQNQQSEAKKNQASGNQAQQ
ncbi:gamma-type small acid-soluble spore protein [Falsibacillus pallidus]|uniref:Small, acid-soluble spore protein gamma-type n=1 Tax=Falsibacillus pallidus TaxID=493781 RepID=A0A370G1R6_9BACI|nr:gamma-type small acid-soluble spore protein [Falsibacillus pallidus]RDI37170.1 small acid-soluble spore protein E (minor gamma-type SASP) [Falsibacillus pallidus]